MMLRAGLNTSFPGGRSRTLVCIGRHQFWATGRSATACVSIHAATAEEPYRE